MPRFKEDIMHGMGDMHIGLDNQNPMRFAGGLPMTVYLERNQVLNRVVMDVFGWGGPGIVFARNFYERVEKSLDVGSWLVAGVTFPLLLDRLVNRNYTRRLLNQFPKLFLNKKATPLGMPFEWFGKLNTLTGKQLTAYGLKALPQKLARHIFKAKVFYILLPDMLLMASKGQGYFWGKNAITEFLTHKKGFVGEFNYAKDDYLKLKSQNYEKTKKKRMLTSFVIGYGSALALPLLIWSFARSTAKKGPVALIKKLIPAFNYTDTIFMSKWVLTWHTFFNWNIPSILSSRDSHEFRENFVKTSVVLGIYSIGDDIIGGGFAKMLNRYATRHWKAPILSPKKGLFGMPQLMPLDEIIQKYGVKSKAYKLARLNFWVGIFGVCVAINSILPILNNYYTRKKSDAGTRSITANKTTAIFFKQPC